MELLLKTVEIDDERFWARMAKSLSFNKLSEMTATTEDQNFQHLIHAAVDILKAKGVRIVEGVPSRGQARWFLDQGQLALRYRGVTAIFASSKVGDLSQAGVVSMTGPADLQRRARRADIRLTEVSVGTKDRHFDYGSEDGAAITQDVQLDQFASALGGAAEVRKAVARVGERDVLLDFLTSTAYGRTAGLLYLSELVRHIPIFSDYSREEVGEFVASAISGDGVDVEGAGS